MKGEDFHAKKRDKAVHGLVASNEVVRAQFFEERGYLHMAAKKKTAKKKSKSKKK